MKRKIFKNILLIILFIFIIFIKNTSNSNAETLKENSLLYPIGNTNVEMYVEYEKGTRNYNKFDRNGNNPICTSLFNSVSGWKEEKNSNLSTSESHNGIDITVKDASKVVTNTYDIINVADSTVIATSGNRSYDNENNYGSTSFNDNNKREGVGTIGGNNNNGGGYGNYIITRLNDYKYVYNGFEYNVYVQYSHLYKDSIKYKKGDTIEAGEVIAKMGSSGDSGHPHLHFEVMYGKTDSEIVTSTYHLNTNRCFLNPEDYIEDYIKEATGFENGVEIKKNITNDEGNEIETVWVTAGVIKDEYLDKYANVENAIGIVAGKYFTNLNSDIQESDLESVINSYEIAQPITYHTQKDGYIATGDYLVSSEGNTYTIIVYGDADGNGTIGANNDYQMIIETFIDKNYNIDDYKKIALDVNMDGMLDVSDVMNCIDKFHGRDEERFVNNGTGTLVTKDPFLLCNKR